MMKSLLAANRSEKDSFRIPRSVQQSIPIRRIFADGIWQVGQKYSKTWRFSDINYAASSLDDRRSIFRSYGAVLNSLPTDATAKITIINRRLNPVDFQRTMLMPRVATVWIITVENTTRSFWTRLRKATIWCRKSTSRCPLVCAKSSRPAHIFGASIPTCLPALGGWIPGPIPFPALTGCGSCMTSSDLAKKRLSGLTCPRTSSAASTSAT